MKLRKCEISGKVIYSKRIVLLVRQKTLNRHYHTHKTNSKFLRRKSNISAKKKERGCTFFTVQHLWSVLSYFSIADYILPQYFRFHYWKFVSVITTSISSVCPRSCGLFRLPSKCFHLSTSEYLLTFFSPRCDHLFSFSCRFFKRFPHNSYSLCNISSFSIKIRLLHVKSFFSTVPRPTWQHPFSGLWEDVGEAAGCVQVCW